MPSIFTGLEVRQPSRRQHLGAGSPECGNQPHLAKYGYESPANIPPEWAETTNSKPLINPGRHFSISVSCLCFRCLSLFRCVSQASISSDSTDHFFYFNSISISFLPKLGKLLIMRGPLKATLLLAPALASALAVPGIGESYESFDRSVSGRFSHIHFM